MPQVPNLDPTNPLINPSAEQAAAFLALDPEEPVVYINLHEYHERARYPSDYDGAGGPADVSGREAYHRYLKALAQNNHKLIGGRMIIAAPIDVVMVGSGPWHEAVITYYPSRAASMTMADTPGYAATVVHRDAGLKSVTAMAMGRQALDWLPSLM